MLMVLDPSIILPVPGAWGWVVVILTFIAINVSKHEIPSKNLITPRLTREILLADTGKKPYTHFIYINYGNNKKLSIVIH